MDQFTSPDERQRNMANTFFGNAKGTSEQIALHTVKSIEKNRLYVVTQKDGRNMWMLKRLMPETYFKVFCFLYKKGIFEKHLETLLKIMNIAVPRLK
jgi:hypothetical protein